MIILKTLEILEKYSVTPNPDTDQHFMTDEKMLKKIASAAKIKSDEVVLEIGAGIGNLTKLLAKKAKKVYAIEKDYALSEALCGETKEFDNVEIIIADALKTKLPEFDKLVSNLPYQICEALLQKLTLIEFKLAVVCVPKKFAERITASRGDKNFSVLSIKSQAFFDIKLIAEVPRESFMPVPRVDSRIVQIMPKKKLEASGFFMQEFLREYDKIAKNAIREALIYAASKSKGMLTKRSAKDIIKKMGLSEETLQKRVFTLDENEISLIGEKVRKISETY